MAVYPTGRTRRLVVEGEWTSDLYAHFVCTGTWPSSPNRLVTLSERQLRSLEIRALGCAIVVSTESSFSSWPSNASCTTVITGGSYGMTVAAVRYEATAFETTDSDERVFPFTVAHGSELTESLESVWRIEADVEEWFEITDPIEDSDSEGFPSFGGTAVRDGVTGRRIRFFEKLRPGGQLIISVSGLVELETEDTISSDHAEAVGEIFHGIDRRATVACKNDTASVVITGSVGGEPVAAPYVKVAEGSTFDTSTGFVLEIEKGFGESGESYGYVNAGLDVAYDFEAALFQPGGEYDGSLDLQIEHSSEEADFVVSADPMANTLLSQKVWSAFCVLDGVSQASEGVDERLPVRCWVVPSSLESAGEDAEDWRLSFRGKQWPAWSLEHEDVLLDDGSSLEGWSGHGATVTLEPGAVRATATEEPSSVVRAWPESVNAEGHRFLQLRWRSVAADAQPLMVSMDEKAWNIVSEAAGEWTTTRIDLCFPAAPPAGSDDKESRYPTDSDGEVVDSPHWGVSIIDAMTFSSPGSWQIEVDDISLVSEIGGRLTVSPAWKAWRRREEDGSVDVRPFVWTESDGRIADASDMEVDGSPSWSSLSESASLLAQRSGWTVEVLPGADDYHSSDRESTLLDGSGLIWSDGWTIAEDVACRPATTVVAQALWDEVEVYGGAGDVWQGVSFGGPTLLRTAKMLRGRAWGFDRTEEGSWGTTFVLRTETGDVRGSGGPDVNGFALTGSPGGRPDALHKVVGSSTESEPFPVKTRMRHRRVVVGLAPSGSISTTWHADGTHVRAYVGVDGTVRVGRRSNASDAIYFDTVTTIEAQAVAVAWLPSRDRALVMITAEGESLVERISTDGGETWSMATILATGDVNDPTVAVHPDGRRFVYWRSGDQINGVMKDLAGNVLRAVSGVRTSVESKGTAVSAYDVLNGKAVVELLTVEGGSLIATESTDGEVFA